MTRVFTGEDYVQAKRLSYPADETPMEFRTQKEHYFVFPRNGIISVHDLRASRDGRVLEIGRRKYVLKRDFLHLRPDLLKALIATLISWRDTPPP